MNTESIHDAVKDHYGRIAQKPDAPCCGPSCCSPADKTFSVDYSTMKGYVREADLNLGCGMPVGTAAISPGDTVVDLGSGAGNDAFVARHEAGPAGRVIGIDMTEEMIRRANATRDRLGLTNVEFRLGEIEQIPLDPDTADVVISNCVLNLVPDKDRAFSEILRILKPGGHFSVSDIVLEGTLPPSILRNAELYAGCIAGALQRSEYIAACTRAGFVDVRVTSSKEITLPASLLAPFLNPGEIREFRASGATILSITLVGTKPSTARK